MHNHIHNKQVIERLSRIEGHVRGIKKMVEEDKACEDVLIQVSAVQAALKSVSVVILQDHLDHCVVDAINEGEGDQALKSFSHALKHVLK